MCYLAVVLQWLAEVRNMSGLRDKSARYMCDVIEQHLHPGAALEASPKRVRVLAAVRPMSRVLSSC
jgi:hypothetical protein